MHCVLRLNGAVAERKTLHLKGGSAADDLYTGSTIFLVHHTLHNVFSLYR